MTHSKRVHFASTNVQYDPLPPTPSPSHSPSSLPSSASPELHTPPPPAGAPTYHPSPYPRSSQLEQPSSTVGETYPSPFYNPMQALAPQDSSYPAFSYGPPSHDSSPYAFPSPYLPPTQQLHQQDSKEMHVHILLAYSPFSSSPPSVSAGAISYDLTLPPHTLPISPQTLQEPATHPPLTSLTIFCPLFYDSGKGRGDWDVVVKPSGAAGPFVSVGDVLTTLYRALRLPVHPDEYQSLTSSSTSLTSSSTSLTYSPQPQNPSSSPYAPPYALPAHANDQHLVATAYHTRCARILDPSERTQEQNKGVKRVDFLRGRTRFTGLSLEVLVGGAGRVGERWEMNVA